MSEDHLRHLQEWAQLLADFAESLNKNSGERSAFYLPLGEFSTEKFNEVLDWLGVSRCRFVGVLHEHKNETYDLTEETTARKSIRCGDGGEGNR